ncbi:MAG: hypothetical protein OEV42_07140 [Deltaproteobacteria bacterium]|nr:hypothetical protein [Deltaproteobacteria bacterium]
MSKFEALILGFSAIYILKLITSAISEIIDIRRSQSDSDELQDKGDDSL